MQDMTTGPIRGHVLRMMSFMLVGMFVQTLYALVDIYWVARLGPQAVAAVSLSSNLMFVVLAVTQTLSVGAVALISQSFGRKDLDGVQRLFNQAACQAVVVGVLFLLVSAALQDRYVGLLASDAETAALGSSFLHWFLPAQSLMFLISGLGSALRGIGSMKPGLVAQVGSVLLNIVLAPVLIFGWGSGHPLGVAGAGLATFLSTLAAVVGLGIYVLRGKTFLRLDLARWRPDWAIWRRMLGIGLPSGGEFLLMSVILGVIYVLIRPFGAEAQAGFGIGMRVMQAGFMPAVALSFALAAVVGQNFGAREHGRVREAFVEGIKLNVGFMLLFTVVSQVSGGWMVARFSSDAAVVSVGADYLHLISFNYVSSGLIMVVAGVFQGLGNTLPSLLASASRLATFFLPVFWLARQPSFTLHQVWLASMASVNLQMVLAMLLLRRELRQRLPVAAPA